MVNIHPDVSEHQPAAANDSFNRPFLAFRAASEYDRPDAKAPANLTWSMKARSSGKIVNFGVYVIPGVVPNDAIMGRLDALHVPSDCVVMIDAESWGTLVTGNHSTQWNALASGLRARQQGRPDLVWGYLNPNVDADLWPTRPAWLGFIQPAYGPSTPPNPRGLNRIGWQYTNGTQNGTGYPASTSPFGRCDHNVMFINYPKPGADMPLDDSDIAKIHDQVVAVIRSTEFSNTIKAQVNAVLHDATHPNSIDSVNTNVDKAQSALEIELSNTETALDAKINAMHSTLEAKVDIITAAVQTGGIDPAAVATAIANELNGILPPAVVAALASKLS